MTEHLSHCLLCGTTDIRTLDAVSQLSCCRSCGYLFDNPRPTPDEVAAFYSRPVQYDEWLSHLPEREMTWQRRLKKLHRLAKRGSLLDVGAGVGQFLALAQRTFHPVTGTEVSSAAVEIAKTRFGIELMPGRVEEIDMGGRRFDNITLFHVLEHVHDPAHTLATCRDLLTPGGMIFIAVPNEVDSLRRWVRKLLHSLGVKRVRYEGGLGIPKLRLDGSLAEIHLSHFTQWSLSAALERQGFDVIEKSLDPYYVSRGGRTIIDTAYYHLCALVKRVTGRNLYDTLWVAGRKR